MTKEKRPRAKGVRRASVDAGVEYELEVIPGLAEFAGSELEELTEGRARISPGDREERVRFQYGGNPRALLRLRRVVAVHRVQRFAIPRPKALLGHQHWTALVRLIEAAVALHAPGGFETFHISAAGSGSSVFARIKDEIAAHTGLRPTEEAGDLALAVRRPQPPGPADGEKKAGWEVAVRLSPRPLSARPWRACDMPGALNGTVASTMMSLTSPSPQDRVLNLACGSGTLLIERLALGPVQGAVGCDADPKALRCAHENLVASGDVDNVRLVRGDAGRAPLPDGWATTVCADLPFGMLVGSHQSNEELYPRLLDEAGRLTRPGGAMVAITQELRLFERVAAQREVRWALTRVIPLKLPATTRDGYIRPRIYLLWRR